MRIRKEILFRMNFGIDDIPGIKIDINNLTTQTIDDKIAILNLTLIAFNIVFKDTSSISYKKIMDLISFLLNSIKNFEYSYILYLVGYL